MTITISIVVTILASPLNLIVDFLFVDILNAPTTNSISHTQVAHQTPMPMPLPSNDNLKQSQSRGSLREPQTRRLGTIREVPSTIRKTHTLLTDSVHKQLEATQKRLTIANQTRATIRLRHSETTNGLKDSFLPDDPEIFFSNLSEELYNHWIQIKRIQERDSFEKIWR